MNKFIVEPTPENLERLKKNKNGKVYWHTADFFTFDSSLRDELSDIFDVYMDALMDDEEEDDEKAQRILELSIGRMIVKAARKRGISPRDYRDQFNNFVTVIWTPVCIWQKDESGEIRYSLSSNI